MPTKREGTTSLCTRTTLIVAEGVGEGAKVLATVEVMDTETHQWSTATDLPQPMYSASATVCGDQLYMLGGWIQNCAAAKSVYTCSVSALLQSYVPSSLKANLKTTSLVYKPNVWRRLIDYHFHVPLVSPFTVDCWQLVDMTNTQRYPSQFLQIKPPQLFTCTIQLPTPGKSSAT